MAFAIHSAEHGTFVGECMGLVFFSKTETAGQTEVATAPSLAEAQDLMAMLRDASDDFCDLEAVEVQSGHWHDLKAADLHIGDMDQNAGKYADA